MTLIKNNIKLLLRCKALILIVLVMVLVTGLLSAVFKDLMTDSFEIKDCNVGYTFSSDCKYEPMKPVFEKVFEDNDIDLIYYPQVDAEKLVENGSADFFIEIDDEGCTVYSGKEYKNEAGVIKITAYSIISQSAGVQVGSYLNEYEIMADPMPDSELYYTIAYTVYFIWCAMIVLGIVLSSERKNRIGLRYRCSPASSIKQYFGYFVPTSIVIILLIGVSVAICTPLFSISWIGIPFAAYLLFIGTVGIIFNLFCVLMGIFGKNVLTAVYTAFGVWVFTNLLAKVYFNFGTTPDWWEKASLLTPRRWVMICSEMIMKNQDGAYVFFLSSLVGMIFAEDKFVFFLLCILTAIIYYQHYGIIDVYRKSAENYEQQEMKLKNSIDSSAEKLFLSEGTVKNYISNILEKAQHEHRTQLAVYYLTGKR